MADIDERIIREEEVESNESKILGLQAMINQMNAMIAENERRIAEGNDVVGRKRMIEHLKAEVATNQLKIKKLQPEETTETTESTSEN